MSACTGAHRVQYKTQDKGHQTPSREFSKHFSWTAGRAQKPSDVTTQICPDYEDSAKAPLSLCVLPSVWTKSALKLAPVGVLVIYVDINSVLYGTDVLCMFLVCASWYWYVLLMCITDMLRACIFCVRCGSVLLMCTGVTPGVYEVLTCTCVRVYC